MLNTYTFPRKSSEERSSRSIFSFFVTTLYQWWYHACNEKLIIKAKTLRSLDQTGKTIRTLNMHRPTLPEWMVILNMRLCEDGDWRDGFRYVDKYFVWKNNVSMVFIIVFVLYINIGMCGRGCFLYSLKWTDRKFVFSCEIFVEGHYYYSIFFLGTNL